MFRQENPGSKLGILAHSFNPGTQEAEAGRFLSLAGHPGPDSKLKDSQGFIKRPSHKNKEIGKTNDSFVKGNTGFCKLL